MDQLHDWAKRFAYLSTRKLDVQRAGHPQCVTLNFSEFYFGNLKLHLGAEFQNFNFANPLQSIYNPNTTEVEDQFYINYTFNGVYDDLDDTYFSSALFLVSILAPHR